MFPVTKCLLYLRFFFNLSSQTSIWLTTQTELISCTKRRAISGKVARGGGGALEEWSSTNSQAKPTSRLVDSSGDKVKVSYYIFKKHHKFCICQNSQSPSRKFVCLEFQYSGDLNTTHLNKRTIQIANNL